MRDVLFYDSVGTAYTGETLRTTGIGGTEQNVVLLAEELVKSGLAVTVATSTSEKKTYEGVEYVPLASAPSARTLVHLRYGELPTGSEYERRILFSGYAVCIAGAYDKYDPSFRRDTDLVVVSSWQLELFRARGF